MRSVSGTISESLPKFDSGYNTECIQKLLNYKDINISITKRIMIKKPEPQISNKQITLTFYSQKRITKEAKFPLKIFGGWYFLFLKRCYTIIITWYGKLAPIRRKCFFECVFTNSHPANLYRIFKSHHVNGNQTRKLPFNTMICIKIVHRNHHVEYYPKEGSLPAMIEKYEPSDYQNDNFYERFMEQRTRDLKNPSTTDEHDSFPFPIEPLRSISSTNKPKRSSMHSNSSGIASPFASSRTPVLSPAIPMETSTPHPSSSQHAQTAQLSPREHLSPIQQFIRNSATRMARSSVKSRSEEPKYNRSQPNYPDLQSVLRTRTRQVYKL